MAKFNLVDKQVILERKALIKFQIVFYCFIKNITLSDSEIDCLVLLSINNNYDLTEFCNLVVDNDIFSSTQTVRNSIVKMERLGLIEKSGKSKQRIVGIPSTLNLQTEGNILLNYKIIYVAASESKGVN